MPIYEYQCSDCGRVFEEWAKSAEAHKDEKCPDCGGVAPRIMSRTSFVLKGNGWYVSDYGYRKGISDEGGAGAPVPAKAKPVTPAAQGEKSLAKTDSVSAPKPAAKEAATTASSAPESTSKSVKPEAKTAPKTGTKTE